MKSEQEYIYMVYEKGSFSKAAQALYLTQPALSIAVQKVESEIGMPLFDRGQKPLGLTEAGHIYIEKLRQMRILEEELHSRLLDLTSMSTGNVRIGATSYLLSCILPPVLLQFKKRYPGVNLDIVEAGSYELKELLREQRLDITFVSRLEKDAPFSSFPAFQDRLVLAVPSVLRVREAMGAHALTGRDIQAGRHMEDGCPAVDLRAFEDVPFILLEPKYDLRKRTDAFFQAAGIQPRICMEVAQIVTACALSQTGLGATFLPDRAVVHDFQNMLFYKVSNPQVLRDMNLVTNRRSYLSCAAQRFIDMFAGYYQETANHNH